ncbi:GNAT family N-acetyltransferase [Streptomyces sp. NPDC003023]|uniref:GNAT family N-acetyltransferase n=1 Tax=Streptomyces sp. NPDC003023 TaxID=3364675 RepID=UPI0036BF2E00
MPHVRPYRPTDRAAVFDICVRTAHAGGDARDIYPDPELMPSLFAAPYLRLEPELAFVLDNGEGRAVGYVLGTADTPRFVKAFREEWLPLVRDRFPAPEKRRTRSDDMTALLHDPEHMLTAETADYPAHLHIDLLPGHQGRGHGRQLMGTLLDALHDRGVARVHLCMVNANTGARAFYDRLGFHKIEVPGTAGVTYLGRGTDRHAQGAAET